VLVQVGERLRRGAAAAIMMGCETRSRCGSPAATVADDARSALLVDLLGRVAGCFPRRETRQSCRQMISGLLMELEDHNCWTIAEAAGHRGPHRLQHLLSRAVWDDQQVLDIASAWAVSHLDDGDAVLIVDGMADEKSYADAAGAARQYNDL
jgi:SRSO17 transposase